MTEDNKYHFMSAVGFKPPHKGHLKMIEAAVGEAAAKNATYKLFIGQSERDGITLDQSLGMLEIFLNDAGILSGDGIGRVHVIPVRGNTDIPYADNKKNRDLGRAGRLRPKNPMDIMVQTALDLDVVSENSTIVVPTSQKDEGRPSVFKSRIAKQRPDITVVGLEAEVEAVAAGGAELSATRMRAAINNNNYEEFKEYIPESSLNKAEYIWEKVLGRELPVDELDGEALNEMIVEGLKNKIKNLLSEGWPRSDPEYEWDQADAREGEPDWRDPKNYVDEDDENPDSDHWRSILQQAVDGDQGAAEIRDAVFKLRDQQRLGRREKNAQRRLATDDLEEASSMGGVGGGDVGGYSGPGPAKRDGPDTLIREVYDYLVRNNAVGVD